MRAATRERLIRIMARGGTIMVLVISICFLVPKAAAQSDNIRQWQYLMERNAEVLLARGAAYFTKGTLPEGHKAIFEFINAQLRKK